MEGLLLQLINPMSECMDVGFISNCSQFRKSDLNSFYFNHLFTLLSNWSKWLRTASGSSWSDLGHAVPCLEQDWVKNEHTCCRSRSLKTSFGSHPVLQHHFISSVWVQQNMLQCATGSSWSVLGHMMCLVWSRLGWKMSTLHQHETVVGAWKPASGPSSAAAPLPFLCVFNKGCYNVQLAIHVLSWVMLWQFHCTTYLSVGCGLKCNKCALSLVPSLRIEILTCDPCVFMRDSDLHM
jgi:hypothetical protein